LALENGYSRHELFSVLENEWTLVAAALPRFLLGDNVRLQELANALDTFLSFSGHWDDSLRLHQQAEEKAAAANDFLNAGWRAYQTGFVHYLRGQSSEVLACAARAEAHWRQARAVARELSIAIRLRGMGLQLEKNYPAALKACREALDIQRSIRAESIDVSIALNDIGEIERSSGAFDAAERDYREALRIAKKIDYRDGIAFCTGNLANLALDRSDWLAAEQLAREALALAERIGRQELIGFYGERLAKSLAQQGRASEGLPFARRSVEIFTKLQQRDNLKEAQATLKECEG
jgi:tetratricopeptide (TPR) repeat protein